MSREPERTGDQGSKTNGVLRFLVPSERELFVVQPSRSCSSIPESGMRPMQPKMFDRVSVSLSSIQYHTIGYQLIEDTREHQASLSRDY